MMDKHLMVLLVAVACITYADFSSQRKEFRDKVSPIQVVANSLIEGVLAYSKRQDGSSLPPRVDLVFVLDSSSSVGGHIHFKSLKVFIQSLVSEFSVSPSTTRVGLVLCSTHAHLQFGLNQFINRECTLKALKNLRYRRGSRCLLDRALDLTKRVVFKKKNDLNAKKMVFVISAGKQHNGPQAAAMAVDLRETGAEVFLLCVGSHVVSRDQRISSKPLRTHRLHVNSYGDLVKVADEIKGTGLNQACHTKGTVYDECRRRCQCSNGQMINCYRVRKEFTSMSLDERRLYIRTLKTVSTVQPYKRVYDEMTSYHPRWFKSVHQLKYFFPWHRWYILIFENFLRQVDCRVTVPYWDWSRAISNRAVFRSSHIRDVWHPGPHGLGGDGLGSNDMCVQTGPFCKGSWLVYFFLQKNRRPSCLTREFNSCFSQYLFNAKNVSKLLKLPFHKFKVFEKQVRHVMHDQFHNSIGGVMSREESANAPEFWFHHGYLDKLWADWQRRGLKFKHQYYHRVTTKLPGANISGANFIDLSRQPYCVKVVHEQPIDMVEREDEFDRSIKKPHPVYWCRNDDNK